MFSSLCVVVAAIMGLVGATPIDISVVEKRVTTATAAELANFELFAQYAGAAYCTNVVDDPTATLIICDQNEGSCAKVEAAKAFLLDSFYEINGSMATGYIAIDPTNDLIIVAFEGTPGLTDFISVLDDVEIARDDSTICGTANTNDGCEIHHGFLQVWSDAQDVVESALAIAVETYPTYSIVFTGHSLGAAVASIAAAVERNAGYIVDLYTFGSPRIGATDIVTYITNQAPLLGNNYRVTDYNDEVPQLPAHLDLFGADWEHISPEYYITINGTDITPAEIDVITTPLYSTAGNSQWNLVDGSITAHREYFGYISGCAP